MTLRSLSWLLLISLVTLRADVAGDRIAAATQREIDAGLFPGAVVLVGTADRVLYHAAFGHAQVDPERVPMRPDSVFDVASLTKVVATATAIAICRDRGLVTFDAPISEYLPDLESPVARQLTLRQLAAHVSGFPDYPRVSRGGALKGSAIFQHMLLEEPNWEPGTRYQYACRNAIYMSLIVERVTGRSFEEFCREEIFVPLMMQEAAFNRIPASPRVVGTHHPLLGENHNVDGRDAGRAVGNAGLFVTAGELAHFSQMMLGGGSWRSHRIIESSTLVDMTQTALPGFPRRAFLWEIDPQSRHRPQRLSPAAYGHSGSTGMSLWIDPGKSVFTLVLTNRTHPRFPGTDSGKEPSSSPRVHEQYVARSSIADAALAALGY